MDLPRYDEVIARYLAESERPYPTIEHQVPLVIEPKRARGGPFLRAFLKKRSASLQRSLFDHGALLLRGFEVSTEKDFESAVSSIRGIRPMNGYFMAEPGRELIPGTKSVFATNLNFATGGDFTLKSIHSENSHRPDVPTYLSFWCKRKSWYGGETALVHMANAYAELPKKMRTRFERRPLTAYYPSLEEIANRYGLSPARTERFFRDLGVSIVLIEGQKHVRISKQTVCKHPHTRKSSLLVNLAEIEGFTQELWTRLAPNYSGKKWFFHRRAMSGPKWKAVLLYANEQANQLVHRPDRAMRWMLDDLKQLLTRRPPVGGAAAEEESDGLADPADRVADQVRREEIALLAGSVSKHCSVFHWRAGDILIIDNMQMLHGGLPGLGPRTLRVMLCNPMPTRYPQLSGVIAPPANRASYRSLDFRLRALGRRGRRESARET